MKQIIQNYKTGKLSVEEVPSPVIQSGGVLVNNAFSLISAGTERSTVELARKSLIGKARSRPEDFKKVMKLAKKQGLLGAYKTAMSRLEQPTALGYSSSGVIIEAGINVGSLKAGDRVACAGAGYASHAEVIFVPKNLCAKIPAAVPLDWAAFTTLGAIALQGVRQADINIGQNVAVIGLGLLGQLTAQILKASGCRVVGLDTDDNKLTLASKSGIDFAFNVSSSNLVSHILHLTSNYGVDAVIITAATSSNDPFLLAPQICRDRARVVLVGVAKLDFPREPYYHKELSLVLARSYGPGRYDAQYEEKGIDYPIGYVRWTEKRNMEAVLGLMQQKKLNIEPLISHRFKIAEAQKAYNLILGKTREKPLGILFEYDGPQEQKKIFVLATSIPRNLVTSIRIGFIGPGSFARSFLLPNIRENKKAELVGVADIQGALAKMTGEKFGFNYCTSDCKKIMEDKKISTIFIATRHNLHASLIIEALKAGKHVFCEKPLCLNAEELHKITKVYNDIITNDLITEKNIPSPLMGKGKDGSEVAQLPNDSITPVFMIGFNRRFAPLVIEARTFLGQKIGPYVINYRINAGKLPPDHWTLDPEQGGGRIIGEVCHFVDLVSYLCHSRLVQVHAEALGNSKNNDDIVATLKYEDGSLGTISYFATGDKDFPKERIEIFGDEEAIVIDDFNEAIFSCRGEQKRIRKSQDKGYRQEINEFLDTIATGKPAPIPFAEIVAATSATFAINESVRAGETVDMPKIELKIRRGGDND